ncbi:MAG: hypothetical protein Harvfovirus5_1, partial [Harvfovirus sp.]
MTKIKLRGFQMYDGYFGPHSRTQVYILPVYSFKCPCDFDHYIMRQELDNNYEEKIFRPKYLKNFMELKKKKIKELIELIPHETIKISPVLCEHSPFKVNSMIFFKKISCGDRPDLDSDLLKSFITCLKNTPYFEIDHMINRFIIDYWAYCSYSWYIKNRPPENITFQEITYNIDHAFETNLLITFEYDRSKFK